MLPPAWNIHGHCSTEYPPARPLPAVSPGHPSASCHVLFCNVFTDVTLFCRVLLLGRAGTLSSRAVRGGLVRIFSLGKRVHTRNCKNPHPWGFTYMKLPSGSHLLWRIPNTVPMNLGLWKQIMETYPEENLEQWRTLQITSLSFSYPFQMQKRKPIEERRFAQDTNAREILVTSRAYIYSQERCSGSALKEHG